MNDGSFGYSYNGAGEMTAANTAKYYYDANGRRVVTQNTGGETDVTVYSSDALLRYRKSLSSGLIEEHHYVGRMLVNITQICQDGQSMDDCNPLSPLIDSDDDGVPDNQDAFPLDPRYALDVDSDGLPDEWEQLYGGTAAVSPGDTDQDGLSALKELAAGTDPTRSDTDDDGELDGAELLAGRDPLLNEAAVTSVILQLLLD